MSKKINKNKWGIFEIEIEKKYFPKTKGNKAKLYAKQIAYDMEKLHDVEIKLDINLFSSVGYKEILMKRIKNKKPVSFLTRISLNKEIELFDYEYHNYCMRVYNYRETLRSFISEFLEIRQDNFKDFITIMRPLNANPKAVDTATQIMSLNNTAAKISKITTIPNTIMFIAKSVFCFFFKISKSPETLLRFHIK